jgi:hypothetical protein
MAGNQRGQGVPAIGNELLQRILVIENALGIQASGTSLSGFTIRDNNGESRVRIGALPNGDYGMLLFDPNTGATQETLPGKVANVLSTTALTTTSTSPVSIAGTPTVVCTLGASGSALVRMSSLLALPSGNTSTIIGGWCQLEIDGSLRLPVLGAQYSVTAAEPFGGFLGTVTSEYLSTGWAPDEEHTFTVKFYSESGQSITFYGLTLTVQPI